MRLLRALGVPLLLLAGCRAGDKGDPVARAAAPAIGPHEVLNVAGTEPFWSGEIVGTTMTWHSTGRPAGARIAVIRFAGRNGVGFSGTLEAQPFELAASQAPCTDGMSQRMYPFAVTVQLGGKVLRGCGWTQAHPRGGQPDR